MQGKHASHDVTSEHSLGSPQEGKVADDEVCA